ncbi:PREDICTED: uncharacterized protein LOC107343952 [Acropora digitifera]|uniref:uncharacterized protein LOC107343952 n=1 Tax=Acropora digitifera TaxID=70779 RepID=UPI00077A2B8D|nr:PREDICTED: uncharacterized protein LOC107343952 [Acropora digitifera]
MRYGLITAASVITPSTTVGPSVPESLCQGQPGCKDRSLPHSSSVSTTSVVMSYSATVKNYSTEWTPIMINCSMPDCWKETICSTPSSVITPSTTVGPSVPESLCQGQLDCKAASVITPSTTVGPSVTQSVCQEQRDCEGVCGGKAREDCGICIEVGAVVALFEVGLSDVCSSTVI